MENTIKDISKLIGVNYKNGLKIFKILKNNQILS